MTLARFPMFLSNYLDMKLIHLTITLLQDPFDDRWEKYGSASSIFHICVISEQD
jgi:hypothetical protein